MFLLNSRLTLVTATLFRSTGKPFHGMRVPLLPKLRGYFAEFLPDSYPERLRILSSPTCVGLGYGHVVVYLEAVSWRLVSVSSVHPKDPIPVPLPYESGFAYSPAMVPARVFRHPVDLTFRVTPSRLQRGAGILTCFPSATPFGLALGAD